MKLILKIFFIFLIHNISFSQSGWFYLNSGINTSLNSITCLDSNIIYTCGDWGRILKSTNAGANWTLQVNGFMQYSILSTVFSINENIIYVGGQNGIGKTTNGGLNWNLIYSPSYHIFSLCFTNQYSGYASGKYGIFLRTTNEGVNWLNMTPPVNGYIESLFFIDTGTGYAAGGGSIPGFIFKTTNAGLNWINLNISQHTLLKSIFFVNNYTGYTCGIYLDTATQNSIVLKTTNQGVNWTNNFILPYSSTAESIFFINDNTGYFCGYRNIFKTTNGGINWYSSFNFTGRIWDIRFINNSTGYAVGDSGVILKTTTGGEPIGIKPISNVIPDEFVLYQNYPNPFNGETIIKFDVNKEDYYNIKIFDAIGREIRTFNPQKYKAGSYIFKINSDDLSSGIYFYQISSPAISKTVKLVLLK